MKARPYLLSAPMLAVFLGLVLIPIGMTVLLSFYDWGQYKGIVEEFTLKNWRDMAQDSYFYGVFLRTFRIALAVTVIAMLIGVPEAYILNRMKAPWRGLFLLVAIGPLLISVVARTLGWALLFGSTGLVNQALLALRLVSEPLPFMFTEWGVIIVLVHVLMPLMTWPCGPPCSGSIPRSRTPPVRSVLAVFGVAARRAAPDRAGHPFRRGDRLRARGQRLRDTRHHRRATGSRLRRRSPITSS